MGCLIMGMVSIMLPRADVAAQRLSEVLATEPTVRDPEAPIHVRSDAASGARIAFNDVSFRYTDDGDPALSHVSFVAEPGTTLAIVGPTGSGKSTIVKLIERFYDPTAGSVTLDGVDLRELSQADLRANLGYVPQKAFLFEGTVESNIAYGDEGADEVAIRGALEVACALDFVEAREGGMLAPIAQGGDNVSGGQRQRLAMARALVRRPRAYLFDDCFSALDYATDARVRAALPAWAAGSTVILVAQRISTVLAADRIVVLDEGRVAGVGTHRELMETCPAYQEIALSQLTEEELADPIPVGGDLGRPSSSEIDPLGEGEPRFAPTEGKTEEEAAEGLSLIHILVGDNQWSDLNWFSSLAHGYGLFRIAQAHIAGVVWQDENYNGIQDAGENVRIPNVPVSLKRYWFGTDATGTGWHLDETFNQTTTSDGQGHWIFDNLDVAGKRMVNGKETTVLYGFEVTVDDLPKGYGVTHMNRGTATTDSDLNEDTKLIEPGDPQGGLIVLAQPSDRRDLVGNGAAYILGPNGTVWVISLSEDSDYNDTGLVPYALAAIAGVVFDLSLIHI